MPSHSRYAHLKVPSRAQLMYFSSGSQAYRRWVLSRCTRLAQSLRQVACSGGLSAQWARHLADGS